MWEVLERVENAVSGAVGVQELEKGFGENRPGYRVG